MALVLMMLELSAAFDSVDHSTLLWRWKESYGINCFSPYLDDCSQCFAVSSPIQLHSNCCVECHRVRSLGQSFSSCIWLTYYSSLNVISFCHMLILMTLRSTDSVVLQRLTHFRSKFPAVLTSVSGWMMANRFQLNPLTTEVMWCSLARCQH